MDRYKKIETIGEGSYGKVYKAEDTKTRQIVALKKFRSRNEKEGIPPNALREASLLQMLSQSLYIVRLISTEHVVNKHGKPVIYMVLEYLPTDLKKFMDSHPIGQSPNKGPLAPSQVQNFMFQLCKGVAHCHSYGVLHRDLKPQNLLLDKKNGILKIADFGIGRAFTIPLQIYTHEVVTLSYRAPEILVGFTHYSTAVDVWSVGCIFAEMARGVVLFSGNTERLLLPNIFRLLGRPTEEEWPEVKSLANWDKYPDWKPQNLAEAVPSLGPSGVDLLSKMLKYNPGDRISAKEAMDHPYFDSLDKSQF